MDGKVYVAKSAFSTSVDGRKVSIPKGTTVREGHPLLDSLSSMFDLLVPTYEVDAPAAPKRKAPKVEQATAAPGEVREVSNPPKREDEQ